MRLLLLLLLAGVFYSCEVKVNAPGATKESPLGKIRNGIEVKANGVDVEQAFLTYEDGTLVDESNTTSVNKKLKINFVVKGWKAENDKVALEANEKITTSDGDIVMDEMNVWQSQRVFGRFRMIYKVFALFNTKKGDMWFIVCAGQAKLTYPTADI